MSGGFNRDRVPDWLAYADKRGIKVKGRGKWRNVLCDFHADTKPSMRVNTDTGGWICMSCGASGGDTLAHFMERTGIDFVAAARALGAWDDKGAAAVVPKRSRTLSASDGLELLYQDAMLLFVIGSDIGQGKTPNETDRTAAAAAARRVLVVYEGVRR